MSQLIQFLKPLALGEAAVVDDERSTDSSLFFSYEDRQLELRHTRKTFLELRDASQKCRLELFDTEIGSRITALNRASFLNALGEAPAAQEKPQPKRKKQPASQDVPDPKEAE